MTFRLALTAIAMAVWQPYLVLAVPPSAPAVVECRQARDVCKLATPSTFQGGPSADALLLVRIESSRATPEIALDPDSGLNASSGTVGKAIAPALAARGAVVVRARLSGKSDRARWAYDYIARLPDPKQPAPPFDFDPFVSGTTEAVLSVSDDGSAAPVVKSCFVLPSDWVRFTEDAASFFRKRPDAVEPLAPREDLIRWLNQENPIIALAAGRSLLASGCPPADVLRMALAKPDRIQRAAFVNLCLRAANDSQARAVAELLSRCIAGATSFEDLDGILIGLVIADDGSADAVIRLVLLGVLKPEAIREVPVGDRIGPILLDELAAKWETLRGTPDAHLDKLLTFVRTQTRR